MSTAPRRSGVTHADLLVSLAVLLTVSTAALAQLAQAQETARRIMCAENLKRIGMALLLYSNEDRGRYPRTVASLPKRAKEHARPVWGTPYEGKPDLVPPADATFDANPYVLDNPRREQDKAMIPYRPATDDVSAALFMLLRTQNIPGEAFVCPSTDLEPFDYGGGARRARHWTNWRGNEGLSKHLSYSYQNPYPSTDAIASGFRLNNAISAEFAVASDMNPGGAELTKLRSTMGMRDQRQGNSYNHGRDGQNVLYGDGHVEWLNSGFAGVKRDHVYTFGKTGSDAPEAGGEGVVGSSVGPEDSILLPTARDIGQVDERGEFAGAPKWATPTPEQSDALRERLAGEYEQIAANGAAATLRVTKDQFIATSGPIAITFGYAIDGVEGANARLALTAPQTKGESARLQLAPSGDLVIWKNPYYAGEWKRKK